MTTVNAKSSRKGKQKPPAAPSTVLTITLNPDKTGILIIKRGDLAALSHFTYRDMQEILAAIQQGATQLAEVEKNPPPKDLSVTPTNTIQLPETSTIRAAVSDNLAESGAIAAPSTETDPLRAAPLPTDNTESLQSASPLGTAENTSTIQLSLL